MCVNVLAMRALQSPSPMWPNLSPDMYSECETAAPGDVLRVRQEQLNSVLYLVSGRVQLGIREEGQMRHQLGGLDASSAMLNLPCVVDMVAETRVQLRRQSLEAFQRGLESLPKSVQVLLHDMAAGYRQQTELAISRLAQDAEARCAQWLLQHAQHDDSGAMSVILNQRKRIIAAQLGIAPETFSRVLRNLREHGLIMGSGNVLKLPQPSALELVAAG